MIRQTVGQKSQSRLRSRVLPLLARKLRLWCWPPVDTPRPNDNRADERAAGKGGSEPDYRFTLANERTFLAWQRTALGLLAATVALVRFAPELEVQGTQHILATLLAGLAILCAGSGLHRWRQVDQAMRRNIPLTRHRTPFLLATGLVVIGFIISALVIVEEVTG